ncbi:hypothetical protein BDZ91DRAFT_718095 [Kalaharituber pfeilii]|nr:hypothetical protein BDZ91DRAFT_718095 [Kalaharituber pfeilii]
MPSPEFPRHQYTLPQSSLEPRWLHTQEKANTIYQPAPNQLQNHVNIGAAVATHNVVERGNGQPMGQLYQQGSLGSSVPIQPLPIRWTMGSHTRSAGNTAGRQSRTQLARPIPVHFIPTSNTGQPQGQQNACPQNHITGQGSSDPSNDSPAQTRFY